MSFSYTAYAIGTIGSAAISKSASDSAANTTKKWRHRAIDEDQRQYDLTREDFAPWREAGTNALARLDRASTGDMSDFQTSPGYNFRVSEGNRNVENRFSVGGGGGNAMRALTEYNQNLASDEFGNWWNRQAGVSGVGQTATTATGAFGAGKSARVGAQYGALGDNLGSIGLWDAGNINNALQGGLSNMLYARKPKPAYTGVPT